jgi:hypothetical protein
VLTDACSHREIHGLIPCRLACNLSACNLSSRIFMWVNPALAYLTFLAARKAYIVSPNIALLGISANYCYGPDLEFSSVRLSSLFACLERANSSPRYLQPLKTNINRKVPIPVVSYFEPVEQDIFQHGIVKPLEPMLNIPVECSKHEPSRTTWNISESEIRSWNPGRHVLDFYWVPEGRAAMSPVNPLRPSRLLTFRNYNIVLPLTPSIV